MTKLRLLVPIILLLAFFAWRGLAPEQVPDPSVLTVTGVRTVTGTLPYEAYRSRLLAAIDENGLRVLEGECGKCSLKTIEVTDFNTETINVDQPDMALRLLQAGAAGASGAPLRFYLTRLEDNTARLTYHEPSHVLAIFKAPGLKALGAELDQTFARIVETVQK